jgi:glutamate-ammonia-ligase adenylyltransferase
MALTRARVISSTPGFRQHIEHVIRDVLTRPRDMELIASDVLEMRSAIAAEKGDGDIWDLKYAAGGIVDLEFLAQYLQLVHAAKYPDILSVNTLQVYDHAVRLGLLPSSDADVLRPAGRLYQDLTQVLRLCVTDKFKPDTAGDDLLRVLTRAADAPDFSALEARLRETQIDVRGIFLKLMQVRS